MKYSETIKPASYFKEHMTKILRELNENQGTMIITQNGEAKAAIVDIKKYEEMEEAIAMLELIALGQREIADGKSRPAQEVFRELKERISNSD